MPARHARIDVALGQIRGAREQQEDSAAFAVGSRGERTATPAITPFDILTREDATPQTHALAEDRVLAVVSDGMGGHAAGDLASQLCCRAFLHTVMVANADPNRRAEPTAGRFTSALHQANAAVADAISEIPSRRGMGATLVGIEVAGLSAADDDTSFALDWISVGDSPMFLVRDAEIALLNEDHSLAPALDKLVAEGRMTAKAAARDPRRHMLRSAVSGETIDLIDRSKQSLMLDAGDVVIAATDGLETLEQDEIARIATAYRDDGAQGIVDALLRAVGSVRRVHQDNATVIAFCVR